MDTWNAVFLNQAQGALGACTPIALGATRPQTPRRQSPPERGLTPEENAENAKHLLTTNSLFMDT